MSPHRSDRIRRARPPARERAPEPELVRPVAAAAVRSVPGAVVAAADLRSGEAAAADHGRTRPPAGSDGHGPHVRHTGAGGACAAPRRHPAPTGGRGRRRQRRPQLRRLHTRAAADHGGPAGRAPCAGQDRGRGTCRR